MAGDKAPTKGSSTDAFHEISHSSRILAETASDAIITINEASTIVYVNRAVTKVFGYSQQELLGAPLTMLMPEYLRHLHKAGLKQYIETGKKHISWEAVELPGLHKNGQEISLEVSFGEFNSDGHRFFTGIARDVNERKKTEKELVKTLQYALEARREAEKLSEQLAAFQRITDAALSHLSVEEVLAESLTRIREVLNVDTVAILLLEGEGDEVVAWAAQGLEEEVEKGVRIPVGRGFAGRIIAEKRPVIVSDTSQADIFNPMLRQKGIKSLLGVPLLVEGRPTGVLHVGKYEFTNFTDDHIRLLELGAARIALAIENTRLYEEERAARAEAEAANQAKDEFLTILSHELRTPLTPIIGWVHMMQNGILKESDFSRVLSVINRNAYSLKRLINDLLDMSAILTGKMKIEETSVAIGSVLEEAVEAMRPYARDSKVSLQLKAPANNSEATVKGDRTRLNQAFCNILHNAIKFSPAGGSVQASWETTPDDVVIRVSDQGEGISDQFLPYVFERFRQEDASRTRNFGGLGLGLALVKSFVEAHHGTVDARSEGVGKGSLFTVTLPVENAAPKSKVGDSAPVTSAEENKKRVLIVEDQPDTLEMLSATLSSQGFEVIGCDSATKALEVAGRENFDILISDIGMPAMDGLQLVRDLRQTENSRRIPAIALTGYASSKDIDAALAAGFDMHVSKPVDPTDLGATIRSLLRPTKREI